MSLTDAHKGYEYQDLISAYILLRSLIEHENFSFSLDQKDHINDYFDDIIINTPKLRIKIQVKHSRVGDFKIKDFASPSSNLFIGKISKTIFPKPEKETSLILLTNRGISKNDFIERSKKKGFLSKILSGLTYKILTNKNFINYNKKNIKYFLNNFSIESLCPDFSMDVRRPGVLEKLVLEYITSKIGIGVFPNKEISPEEFLESILMYIKSIRAGGHSQPISKENFIKQLSVIGLQVDYGFMAQQFPLVPKKERIIFNSFTKEIVNMISQKKNILLIGQPGSGKSHEFDDIAKVIRYKTDMVAIKHYCYLEPTDDLILERISIDRMFGNLVSQLVKDFPKENEELNRYYAADKKKLQDLVSKISTNKRVIIMIDGLDHLERVVNQSGHLSINYVNKFTEELFSLKMPKNSCLLISTQPGNHLNIFKKRKDIYQFEMPSWKETQVIHHCKSHGLPEEFIKNGSIFIKSLLLVSEGNPLYLNYLIKEVTQGISRGENVNTLTTYINSQPILKSDISNYYHYLLNTINVDDMDIVQTIALLDFSVDTKTLLSMFPVLSRTRVTNIVNKIYSVIKGSYTQGELRIYHESFRRYVLENAIKKGIDRKELYKPIIDWLIEKDFYSSLISYHYLFAYLRKSNEHKRISHFIEKDFLVKSIMNFMPLSLISKNIALASDSASIELDWITLVRLSQLNKALYTYKEERSYLHEEIAENYLKIAGPKKFVEKIVLNNKPILNVTTGALYCSKIAKIGGTPPWGVYNLNNFSMQIRDKESEALFIGLQASSFYKSIQGIGPKEAILKLIRANSMQFVVNKKNRMGALTAQVFSQFKDTDIVESIISDTLPKKMPFNLLLIIVQKITYPNVKKKMGIYFIKKIPKKLSLDIILALINLEIDLKYYVTEKFISNFIRHSDLVINNTKSHIPDELNFSEWYKTLKIISKYDEKLIEKLIETIKIDGWYRAWITFICSLSLVEFDSKLTSTKKESAIIKLLEKLAKYQSPFEGTPRACDLYSINKETKDSFARALYLLKSPITLKKGLELLEKISNGTTSLLMGSPGGPLIEADIGEIIQNSIKLYSNTERKILLKTIINQYTKVTNCGRYYDDQAMEAIRVSCVLADIGKIKESKRMFETGCRLALSYGFHKDITAWDVIEPVSSLYNLSKKFAYKAFELSYQLASTVIYHTDGKETKWAKIIWYEGLKNANLLLGLKFLIDDIKINSHKRYWVIEYVTEDFINTLIGKINPQIISNLYSSLYLPDFDRTNFTPRLDLLDQFYSLGLIKEGEIYANTLAYWLYNWEYTMTDNSPYLQTFERYIEQKRKFKFKLSSYIENNLNAKYTKAKTPNTMSSILPKNKLNNTKKKYKLINFQKYSILKIQQTIENFDYEELRTPNNLISFGEALFAISKNGKQADALNLLRLYVIKTQTLSGTLFLEKLGDLFVDKGNLVLALNSYAYGFFYARGNHGWYMMGDKESYNMVKKAINISKLGFNKIIAREWSVGLSEPSYFTGANKHLIEIFANVEKKRELSNKLWQENYNIISARLPSKIKKENIPKISLLAKKTIGLEKTACDLLKIRKTIID